MPSYTYERILASPSFVSRMLVPCVPMTHGLAMDVGSGAGYDTFALAEAFEHVMAIDSQRGAVRDGRKIASKAHVTNVEFVWADVEHLRLQAKADCVWCNVMSHNARSRIHLLGTLVSSLRLGGWLMYAEETEGYVLMELDRAIRARAANELRTRVRQIVAGLLGVPCFRFFVSGSAERECSRLGLTVTARASERWKGLTTVDRVWGRADRHLSRVDLNTAGDYTTEDLELQAVRRCARAYMRARKAKGIDHATEMLRLIDTTTDNRLAPLLLVLELAELLPSAFRLHGTKFDSVLVPLAFRPIDWDRVSAVHERLVSSVQACSRVDPAP